MIRLIVFILLSSFCLASPRYVLNQNEDVQYISILDELFSAATGTGQVLYWDNAVPEWAATTVPPASDRFVFWDNSDSLIGWLEPSTGLTITGTALTVDTTALDHGALLGLADDDHTQYLLADGTRALAGAWDMGSQNLTNVDIDGGTVDNTVIGGGTPAAGSFTTVTMTGGQNPDIQTSGATELELSSNSNNNQLVLNTDGTVNIATTLTVDDGKIYSGANDYTFDTTASNVAMYFSGTSLGVLTWDGPLDRFVFSDELTMNLAEELQFRTSAAKLWSSSAGTLEISASTLVNVTGPVTVSGATTLTGGAATPKGAITLGNGVTTFAATKGFHVITGDGAGNTLATITGGTDGTILRLLFVDALVTVTDTDAHTANTVDLAGTATDFTSADDTTLTLIHDGTSWYETGRSVN